MKSLSATLLAAQKKGGKPYINTSFAARTPPVASSIISGGIFDWQLIQSDATTGTYHGCCITGNGTLIRVKYDVAGYAIGERMRWERITNPTSSSTFGTWGNYFAQYIGAPANGAVPGATLGIGAYGDNVIVVFPDPTQPVPPCGNNVQFSLNDGATWAYCNALIGIPGDSFISVCFKDATHAFVLYGESATPQLIGRRLTYNAPSAGTWNAITFVAHGDAPDIWGVACYYDGDYNCLLLIDTGTNLRLATAIYGDDYQVAADTWGDINYLDFGYASINRLGLFYHYLQHLPPGSDFTSAAMMYDYMHASGTEKARFQEAMKGFEIQKEWYERMKTHDPGGMEWGKLKEPTPPEQPKWDRTGAIVQARSLDNLDVDSPFMCQPSGQPPILSYTRTGERWFMRMFPGSEYEDNRWSNASKQTISTPYGLALAADSSYVWGSRYNEVWRMPIIGKVTI